VELAAIARNGELIGTYRTDPKAKLNSVWNYSPTSLHDHATNSPHFQFAMFEQHFLACEMHKIAAAVAGTWKTFGNNGIYRFGISRPP
jgi:hypothetical protein